MGSFRIVKTFLAIVAIAMSLAFAGCNDKEKKKTIVESPITQEFLDDILVNFFNSLTDEERKRIIELLTEAIVDVEVDSELTITDVCFDTFKTDNGKTRIVLTEGCITILLNRECFVPPGHIYHNICKFKNIKCGPKCGLPVEECDNKSSE